MPLIGTAGHVDHGKSTLLQRITGRDPDRLEEEKRRGLTIDLGFGWANLPDGREVSFVDVPGHERFLKNMLAGVEAIDVALFVVAADAGWMPQSEEHLAVLDLLEVASGVVALTKIDAVDAELVEVALAEVEEHLAGSTLEGAPIHPVSALTGEGMTDLLLSLGRAIPDDGSAGDRPRMWVDRSFPIPGAGTVVTGSLLGGHLAVDERIAIYPRGTISRVRGLQSHETSHERIEPGRRVAVNLAGVDHDEVSRGDMIGLPGQWELSSRFTARVAPARFVDGIDLRGDCQIHLGSSAHRVEVLGMEGANVMLRIDRPLPLAAGDRFILRDTGRRLVVGGGRVLDPDPGPTRSALKESPGIDPSGGPDDIADRLLTIRGIDHTTRLSSHSGGGRPSSAHLVNERAISQDVMDKLTARATSLVSREHEQRPLRDGLPIATLAEQLGVEAEIAEALVDNSPALQRDGADVATPGHVATLDPEEEAAWSTVVERLAESLAVPLESELGIDPEIVHLKLRRGELTRISEDLVYLPDQIEQMQKAMAGLGDFTVADFRDAVGISRKYAVPVLEWSDKEGLTVRRGDVRRLR